MSTTLNIDKQPNGNTTGMRRSGDSKSGKNGAPPKRTRYNRSKTACINASKSTKQQNRRRSRNYRHSQRSANVKQYKPTQPKYSFNNCSHSRLQHNTAQHKQLSHGTHTHTPFSHSVRTHTYRQQRLTRPSYSSSDRGYHNIQHYYYAKTHTSWHAKTCPDIRHVSRT